MPHKKFKTKGLIVNKDNQIVLDDMELTYPDGQQAGGIGEFVNDEAYQKMMNDTYAEEIKRANNKEQTSPEHIVFHIGKTVLQLLLAQPGCEGIRLTKIKYNKRNTFVIESLSGEIAFTTEEGKIFNRAIKKSKNDEDPTRSEDIYGYTFGDLYKDIKNDRNPLEDLKTTEFFNII